MDAKLDCTYVDMWVNKIKIRAIVDTGAPINVVSTKFAKRLGMAPDIAYQKEFGTAGLQPTTSQGVYSALPLRFGSLSVLAPAIVLPNQHYNFLIGTAFIKQSNITICHKESSFTILNQHIPLIYLSKDNDTPSRTVNLVYTDGIIPVPFSSLSQLPAIHVLTAKSEDLFTYLLDQTKIHSSPDIHSIILRL